MATVRYFAAARAAAGCAEEPIDAATLEDLIAAMGARHGERLVLVLKVCSYLVDGLSSRDGGTRLAADTTVDVLPPFAGG